MIYGYTGNLLIRPEYGDKKLRGDRDSKVLVVRRGLNPFLGFDRFYIFVVSIFIRCDVELL
jgi:hypothetical protein